MSTETEWTLLNIRDQYEEGQGTVIDIAGVEIPPEDLAAFNIKAEALYKTERRIIYLDRRKEKAVAAGETFAGTSLIGVSQENPPEYYVNGGASAYTPNGVDDEYGDWELKDRVIAQDASGRAGIMEIVESWRFTSYILWIWVGGGWRGWDERNEVATTFNRTLDFGSI